MSDQSSRQTQRIGAVSYLNTKPLVYDLAQRLPDWEIVFDLPSRLADQLQEGRLDVALIPSVEYLNNPGYQIVSDACIACRGPVLSVKLLCRKPVHEIRSLALDEGSRTSAALVRILLKQKFGVSPNVVPLPIDSDYRELDTDAVLLIGDRAIHASQEPFSVEFDLGELWGQWSGKPFVFAMWVARKVNADHAALAQALEASRDAGVAHLEQIAQRECGTVNLSPQSCLRYLRDNLHFTLGEAERDGLQLYFEQVRELETALSTR